MLVIIVKAKLTIFCFLGFLLANAQQIDETKSFLDYIRKNLFTVDTLFYTEDLNDYTLPEIKKYLLRDTIWIVKQLEDGKLQHVDSIILSSDEKIYMQKQLSEQEGKIWADNLLDKSSLTIRDTTYRKYSFVERPKNYNPKTVYSFSKPIFLRENSFCFFYHQYVTAGRGEGQLDLYKKDNGKWRFVQWFYSWGGGGY